MACAAVKIGCNEDYAHHGFDDSELHFAPPQDGLFAPAGAASYMKIIGEDAETVQMVFPCEFPIKVMGYWAEDFDALVMQIVRRHVDNLGEGALRSRESRGGRYMSVTVTIEARSREQLDAIYRDLTSEKRVVMAL